MLILRGECCFLIAGWSVGGYDQICLYASLLLGCWNFTL